MGSTGYHKVITANDARSKHTAPGQHHLCQWQLLLERKSTPTNQSKGLGAGELVLQHGQC